MDKFAFVSRHKPTPEQIEIAARHGGKLVEVGDRDAFTIDPYEFREYRLVIVVHPAAALRLFHHGIDVGVFENGNRAPEGEKPEFYAKALHWFEL